MFINIDKSNYKIRDIKESIDFLIDFLNDGYTYNVVTKVIINNYYSGFPYVYDYNGFNYLKNTNDKVDGIILEITNIKAKNNIVRSYESVEYNEDKILKEVDELLVELSDINFDVYRNYMVKDGENILELWIERERPDFDDGEYDDWYYDKLDIFTIGEVYEPLALLTDWMSEKYSADLVDDGMNSDTFAFNSNSEVFDPEWKELYKKYYDENYLNKRVSSLFVKYVW